MVFFDFIKKLNVSFYRWQFVTNASLESMQFPKDTGFDKGKLGVMAFINNLLVS